MILCDGCGRPLSIRITLTATAPDGTRGIYGTYGRECARNAAKRLADAGVATTRTRTRG